MYSSSTHAIMVEGAAMPVMYKNRLQEYVQRLGLPLPIYQTTNEGFDHAPIFRTTVTVGGETYQSHYAFKHLKDAEQDAARVALELLPKKILDECEIMISKETVFCKSILNEFTVKLNMEIPSYSTVKTEGLLPAFVSSVIFDGVSYTGDVAKCKKEAEQMAARKVIQTILGWTCDSDRKNLLSQIIRSKSRFYASLNQDAVPKENPEMVLTATTLVSPQISFPGLPREQEVDANSIDTTLKLKKPRIEYLSEQASGSANNQPGENQIDVLNQTLNSTIVEAAKLVGKVLLEMVHASGTSMATTVGHLQKNVSDSSGRNEGSKLIAEASVFKYNEALGCASAKPSIQGNIVSMEVVHPGQIEKSGRHGKKKKRSRKSS